jgi:predicted  nucleic acid-binding Zn-ribbon protein
MAKLSAALEEYLKTLPAETQTVLRPLCEANPGLGEGWLRQNDYDRLMDEGKIVKKEADEALKKATTWYEENRPKYDAVMAENATFKTRVAGLETENQTLLDRVNKAVSGSGDEMTQAQMDQLKSNIMEEVGKRGYVSQAEFDKIALQKSEELTKKLVTEQYTEARDRFFKEDFPASVQFTTEMVDIMADHRDEFKEKLDREKFAKFMQENKLINPRQAYEQYVGDRRLQFKIEAARKEGMEAGKQEALKAQIPGSGVTPGDGSVGHLQLRLTTPPVNGEAKPVIPPDVEVGTGQLAALAAQELRQEGKV